MLRRLAQLLCAFLLAACGSGGGGGLVVSCPTEIPPSSGNTLRGVVVEGVGTDGVASGRPVACAAVLLEADGRRVVVATDPRGFFDSGIAPTTYALHVVPPAGSPAAALSVYDLHTVGTGLQLRVTLPLRGPASTSSPRPNPAPAVSGQLLRPDGQPQPGFAPRGTRPGTPGTLGFVWWGAYAASDAPPWVDSGVTDDQGRFQLLTANQTNSRPFFAGNYGGRSAEADLRFFTEYAVVPAARAGTDLGTVRMVPTSRSLTLEYDTSALNVLRDLGTNGLSFVYVLARPSVGDDLELARAFSGPAIGKLVLSQQVPVPSVVGLGFEQLWVLAYAYDSGVAGGSGEISVTRAPSPDGSRVTVSYLPAPKAVGWDAGSLTARWQPAPGAVIHEAYVVDRDGLPLWVAVRALGTQVQAPSGLALRGAFLYVRASDQGSPADWVTGAVLASRDAGPRKASAPSVRTLRARLTQPVRESYSRTIPVP